MSILGCKLFEEREKKPEVKNDYLPFIRSVFGEHFCDFAVNEDKDFAAEVEASLRKLSDSNPFGILQQYFMEEYFLRGKSREEIGKEICENVDCLLKDLENISIQFLRHPSHGKPMKVCLKPYLREPGAEE